MAWWTIDFMTFAGNPVHIMIQKPGSTDVALTPSSTPCTLQEEGNEDLFKPVKTQSGYIEVITDSMTLAEEIIPTQGATREVRIYETFTPSSYEETLWTGWVQPRLLTFTPWKGKQKLKIPIECKLSGFKYQTARLPSANLASIGNILYNMLQTFDYAYFQGGMVMERNGETDDKARAWLRKQIYTSLFEQDTMRYEVLEQICTFFGWTCRQYGDSVFFISNRNVDAPNTGIRRLYTSGLNAASYASYAATWAEVRLTEAMLCSTQNKVAFTAGCRKATATCSLVSFDQSADIDFVQIALKIDDGSINTDHVHYHDEWAQAGHDFVRDREYYGAFGSVNIGDFTVEGYNVIPSLEKNGSTDADEWNASLAVLYTCDYTSDTYWVESTDPTSPAYQQTDFQFHSQYFGYLTFKTVNVISYDTAGTLTIKLNTSSYSQGGIPCVYVKMGDKWYDPATSTWKITSPSAYLTIPKNEDGKFERAIPIPDTMTGNLELQFVCDKIDINRRELLEWGYTITSVSAEYKSSQNETYNSQISVLTVSATNNAKFSDDVTYDSIICIKGELNANSKNFLTDPDGNVSEGLYDTPYDDAQIFSPLQRLCDETVDEMQTIGRLYEIPARWRGGIVHDITPNTMVYIEPLNAWAYCVGWEMNLRDDIIKLKLMQRNYSECNQ